MHGRNVTGNWEESSLNRRDFRQDHGSGPEVPKGHAKRKGKDWCKGKEGREHQWEYITLREWTYKWGDKVEIVRDNRWVCKRCQRHSWRDPRHAGQANHKHEYTLTEIDESDLILGWATMYEVCACGRRGKSIYIDS